MPMRPLDLIPELIDANYSVAFTPVVVYNGVLYLTSQRNQDEESIVGLVKKFGPHLWVYAAARGPALPRSFEEYRNGKKRTTIANFYSINYTIVDPDRVESRVKLRVVK